MSASAIAAPPRTRRIALAGNPNAGKTTLFNALTGLRQKVGNYPGVTVEKKEGRCRLNDGDATLLDLPGAYSLYPHSPDEAVACDVLLGLRPETPAPDAIVVVVDASNLERNLYLATQILELGLPTVVALNMSDIALREGKIIDVARLSKELGAPVVELVASRGDGLDKLRAVLSGEIAPPSPPELDLPSDLQAARDELADLIAPNAVGDARGMALRMLCNGIEADHIAPIFGEEAAHLVENRHSRADWQGSDDAKARFEMIAPLVENSLTRQQIEPENHAPKPSLSDRVDAVLTHRFWGLVIFASITLLVFQAIYSWATIPMDWIDAGFSFMGNSVSARMADGPLRDLIVQGVIGGVGAVVIFLPQILVLFFFIGLLEDTGYMARAALVMDRLMARVGLDGRAFIPMLSSFACAIPGIMATRTIGSPRDRLTTILIAPLMSCSARLPVYILMIGTFIPEQKIGPGVSLRALVMLALYALGVIAALFMGWLFKRTILLGPAPVLMLELPSYKTPVLRNVIVTMWDRGSQFLKRAGTVIFALSILLWFLLSYPRLDPARLGANPAPDVVAAAQVNHSVAGRLGHAVEPLIAPLGFNWKIGVGLIGAMSAREVFVLTMGTVYAVGDADEESKPLRQAMREDKWPDGRPVWTTLTAVSLLVYFVLAMQCISTLAIVRRETGGWKWPIFMQVYMTALAWLASFAIYQGGRFLGWG